MAARRQTLTHLDDAGAARMVDVGGKAVTRREARAECRVVMSEATLRAVRDAQLAKGDALAVARVAGIMAAKRTPDLIPLCHPLPITGVEVEFEYEASAIRVTATARVDAVKRVRPDVDSRDNASVLLREPLEGGARTAQLLAGWFATSGAGFLFVPPHPDEPYSYLEVGAET